MSKLHLYNKSTRFVLNSIIVVHEITNHVYLKEWEHPAAIESWLVQANTPKLHKLGQFPFIDRKGRPI